MSQDLVDRLRASTTQARALDRSELLSEAADEIERLRSEWALASAAVREMRRREWLANAPKQPAESKN